MASNTIPAPKILLTEYNGWPAGYQDSNSADLTPPTALSGGQDINFKSFPSASIRGATYPKTGGTGTGNPPYTGDQPTQYFGALYTTSSTATIFSVADGIIYRHVATAAAPTASTNVFATKTGPVCAMVRPDNGNVYFFNGNDTVIKWSSGGADATVAAIKIGKVACFWRGRIITANLSANNNIVWFSDEYSENFTATNFAYVGDLDITALFVANDTLYVANSKGTLYRITDLVFSAPTGLTFDRVQIVTSVSQGPINQNCIAQIGNFTFWIGTDGIWMFNGFTSINVSLDKVNGTWRSIDQINLPLTACGIGAFGRYYFAIPVGNYNSQTYNNRILYFDPRNVQSSPYAIAQTGIFSTPYALNAGGFAYQQANDSNTYSYWGNATGSLYFMDARFSVFYQMEIDQTPGFYNTGESGLPVAGQDFAAQLANCTAVTGTFNTDNQFSLAAGTKVALKFVPTTNIMGAAVLVMPRFKYVSDNMGQITFQFYSDSGGLPSNTPVGGTYLYTNNTTSYVSKSYVRVQTMTAGTTYWLVTDLSALVSPAVFAWNGKTGGASGDSATYNGTSWSASTQTLGCLILTGHILISAYLETNAAQYGYPHFKKKMKRGFLRSGRVESPGNTSLTWNIAFKDYNQGTYTTQTLTDTGSGSATVATVPFEGYVKDRTKGKSIITKISVTQTGGVDWQVDQLVDAVTLLPRFK